MNFETLKSLGIIKDSQTTARESLGTFKEIFPDWDLLPVKSNLTKTRATLVFRKGNEQANIVLSPAVTALWREDKVNLSDLASFQVTMIDKDAEGKAIPARLSLGMPAGWVKVAEIKVREFKLSTVAQYEALS